MPPVRLQIPDDAISQLFSRQLLQPGLLQPLSHPRVRPVRAFLLAAVLSLFFTAAALLLREIGAGSIRLPSTIRYRYGLKALGTLESAELKENVRYLFAGMKKTAVCAPELPPEPHLPDRSHEWHLSP